MYILRTPTLVDWPRTPDDTNTDQHHHTCRSEICEGYTTIMMKNPSVCLAVCPSWHPCRRRRRLASRRCYNNLQVLIFMVAAAAAAVVGHVAIVDAATDNNNNSDESLQYQQSIIEAEARTARELRTTLTKSQQELLACQSRNAALSDGFQDLYKTHLSNVETLRKCKEGVLTHEDISKFHSEENTNYIASSSSESFTSSIRNIMEHNSKDKDEEEIQKEQQYLSLISDLETSVNSLIRREKTWERTISELAARRDMLEKREGAWERTISDLMAEMEVRAKREYWWMDMKKEMEGRIQALCHMAVLER